MTSKFKKGDVVWSIVNWNGKSTVAVEKLTIQSWGKVQGTASSVKDGKMTKHQIYINQAKHLFLVSDVEDIASFALEIAVQQKAEHIKHYVDCAHYAYVRDDERDSYFNHIKNLCQEIIDEEPTVIYL